MRALKIIYDSMGILERPHDPPRRERKKQWLVVSYKDVPGIANDVNCYFHP